MEDIQYLYDQIHDLQSIRDRLYVSCSLFDDCFRELKTASTMYQEGSSGKPETDIESLKYDIYGLKNDAQNYMSSINFEIESLRYTISVLEKKE